MHKGHENVIFEGTRNIGLPEDDDNSHYGGQYLRKRAIYREKLDYSGLLRPLMVTDKLSSDRAQIGSFLIWI